MEAFSALAASSSFFGGERANRANRKEAEKNRSFQANQSATAHQRQVADLRAAGLNPILSGTGGMGATSAQGAMAQYQDTLSPAVSSARETARTTQELKNMRAEWDNIRQAENTTASQEDLNDANALKVDQELLLLKEVTKKAHEEAGTAAHLRRITSYDEFSAGINYKLDKLESEKWRRGVDRYGSTAKQLLNFDIFKGPSRKETRRRQQSKRR